MVEAVKRRSWGDFRAPADAGEAQGLHEKARAALMRMPLSDREAVSEFLIRTKLFPTARIGATDEVLRDLEAERRVALTFFNLINGGHDDRRDRD